MTDTKPIPDNDVQALFDALPPVVALACAFVSESAELTDEGVDKVKKHLESLKATPAQFVEAVDALQEACKRWETVPDSLGRTYGAVAKRVRDIMNEPAAVQFYKDHITDGSVEKRAQIGSKFAEFADKEAPKAPKEGEAKPAGSVDLNALNFPKRL